MTMMTGAGEGGAGGGGNASGGPQQENGAPAERRSGSLSIADLAFHKKLYGAYVYDTRGKILRFRFLTNDIDAETWARKKATKLARLESRDISDAMSGPLPTLPYAVLIFTTNA